jgi:hypothetical protein
MKASTNSCFSILFLIFFSLGIQIFAQSTILKLPTIDNTSSFDIVKSDSAAVFRVFGDGGFYTGVPYSADIQGDIPVEGAGHRLMWYPAKAAFRVGGVAGAASLVWDDANIGKYSMALGFGVIASGDFSAAAGSYSVATGINSVAIGFSQTASGDYSTALGNGTTAEGKSSTSLGEQTNASGDNSTAMGKNTTASGITSTSMGTSTTANGDFSTAMGNSTTANGFSSTAIGVSTTASGFVSLAMGYLTTASGNRSTAMGNHVSTNDFQGAFIIGDYSSSGTVHSSSAENEMTMRFAGGYRLFTTSDASIGALLKPGSNSWTTISDSTKKENFVYADGENFLDNISRLRLGSWNYKTQNSSQYRHYGPMAQDIFYYFGKDKVGTIGNDTTLSSADMDGIMMICLQALEKRTVELRKATEKISELENIINNLTNEFNKMKGAVLKLENDNSWRSKMVNN